MRTIIIILLFLLSSCSMRINGVKIPDKTSSKIDPEQVFYLTVSFWLGYGLTKHFFNPYKK